MSDREFGWLACSVVGGQRLRIDQAAPREDLDTHYDPPSVSEAVRRALWLMRSESPRQSNPLTGLVRPGDRVLLKPNLIRQSALNSPEWRHVITHPHVAAAVLDLTAEALQSHGEIIVADGPQTDSSFEMICRQTGLRDLVRAAGERHRVAVKLLDLRQEEWTTSDGVMVDHQALPGDPEGYIDVDLGSASQFVGHQGEGHYYGAAFDTAETNREHHGRRHRYRLSATAMSCDVLINLPKLKTHKKAGITASLKNLVGINGNKNWLPHFTQGASRPGGDQFPSADASRRLETLLLGRGKALLTRYPKLARPLLPLKSVGRALFGDTSVTVRSGNWHGNDTLWRMVLDLNRAVLWHDGQGRLRSAPRRYLSIVDGVVIGEGKGPEDPDPVPSGWLLAGANPVAVDSVCATLMGFDWRAIPSIREGFGSNLPPLADFEAAAVRLRTQDQVDSLETIPTHCIVRARPHFGWAGHIETTAGRTAL